MIPNDHAFLTVLLTHHKGNLRLEQLPKIIQFM